MNLFEWARTQKVDLPPLLLGVPTALHTDGYRWTSDGYAVWRAGPLPAGVGFGERHIKGALKLAFSDRLSLVAEGDPAPIYRPCEVKGGVATWAGGSARIADRHAALFGLGEVRALFLPGVAMLGEGPFLYEVSAGGQVVAVVMGMLPGPEAREVTKKQEVTRIEEGAPVPAEFWSQGPCSIMTLSIVSKWHHIGLAMPGSVVDHRNTVFAFGSYAAFAVLQSVVHEAWVRWSGLGSTLGDANTSCYRSSEHFQTFPFPRPFSPDRLDLLTHAGRDYLRYFQWCQRKMKLGATKLHNRLADPRDRCPWVSRLRWYRWWLDLAVLRAYNWDDLQPPCRTDLPPRQPGQETHPTMSAIVERLRALNLWRASHE